MPRTPFFDSATGRAFRRSYDAVLAKWPDGTTVDDVPSRFGTTRVTACGPDGAPPVVLLPGGGATSTVWFAHAVALSASHRVFAVDLIGDVGRSVPSGDPVRTVDDLLDWLRSVLDGLGLARPSLVGHSYGAMIALAFVLREPDRVDRSVLLDPNSCFAGMKPGYLLRALPTLVRPTEARQRAFLAWETAGAPLDADWLDLAAHGARFPTGKTVVPKRPSATALRRLTADTTVVLAPHSRVHDAATVARTVREVSPVCRVVVLSSGTHHSLPMHPRDEVEAALREALGEGRSAEK